MSGLLERLATETPWRQRTIRSDALGKLIVRHMKEIDTARAQGYSWTQIERHARGMWTESGEWESRWSLGAIEERYRKIKKDTVEG